MIILENRHCRLRSLISLMLVVPLLLTSSACNHSIERSISGNVTFDGVPLESGEIQFKPLEGSDGPTAGSMIVNGRYAIPAVAQGVRANNKYRVEITALIGQGRMSPDPNSPSGQSELLENIIPDRYNTQSTLQVTVSSNPSENSFNFDLTR